MAAWIIVAGCVIMLGARFGAAPDNTYSSGSDPGQAVLNVDFHRQSGDQLTLAIRSDGQIRSPAVQARITSALVPFKQAPGVTAVTSPHQVPGQALPYWDEENKNYAHAQLTGVDAFLLGRVTYEKFAAAWSQVGGDPYLHTINRLPKFVASVSLRETTWNATQITGDVATEVARLKGQPGKTIMKYGTGQLDCTLIGHGLIDEFHFSVFPLVVGSGLRLFEGIDNSGLRLRLAGTKTFGNGTVQLTYVPQYSR